MVHNVLDPELSRYLNVEEELAAWLEKNYRASHGPDHDFDVTVRNRFPVGYLRSSTTNNCNSTGTTGITSSYKKSSLMCAEFPHLFVDAPGPSTDRNLRRYSRKTSSIYSP